MDNASRPTPRFNIPPDEIPRIRAALERAARYDMARPSTGIRRAGHDPNAKRARAPVAGGWIIHRTGIAETGPTQAPPLRGLRLREAGEGSLQEAVNHALGELFAPSETYARRFDNARHYVDHEGGETRLPASDGRAHAMIVGDDGQPETSPLAPEDWKAAYRIVRQGYRKAGWRIARLSHHRSNGKVLPGGYIGSSASRGDDPARVAAALDQNAIRTRARVGAATAWNYLPLDQAEARAVFFVEDEEPTEAVPVAGGEGRYVSRRARKQGVPEGYSQRIGFPPDTVRDSRPAPRRRYTRGPLPCPPPSALRARVLPPAPEPRPAYRAPVDLPPIPQTRDEEWWAGRPYSTRADLAERRALVESLAERGNG